MNPLYQILKPTSGANPPAYYSHTGLTQIESCPRRWWLLHSKYDPLVGRYPEPVAPGAMIGSIVHSALERFSVEFSRSGLSEETSGLREFRRQFPIREIVRERRKQFLEEARDNPRAQLAVLEANVSVDVCISVFKDLVRRSYGEPALESNAAVKDAESKSEAPVAPQKTTADGYSAWRDVPCPAVLPEVMLKLEDPPVHGKIDLVITGTDGDTLIEFKTGEPWPEHQRQSALYSFLWWAVTGRFACERQLLYPNQNIVKLRGMSQVELKEEGIALNERVTRAKQELSRTPPSVRIEADRCRSCTVRQLCEEYWTANATAGSRWVWDSVAQPRAAGSMEWRDLQIDLAQTERFAEGLVVRGNLKGAAKQVVCKIPPQFRASATGSHKNVRLLNVGLVPEGEGERVVWSRASEAFWR